MFAGLFDNGDFTSSHLFVVLGTGLAFLAVQLVLSVRFYFHARRQERVINSLRHEFDQGRNDQTEPPTTPSNSVWVQWVLSNYSNNAPGTPCNFNRDDALQELDARITSNGDYLLLQRMGVMAPLLGVVLTVIGFYWLEIGDEQQSLQAIMLAVAPLVSGVGTGAVLALVNQALLHVAGHRAESLRMAARKWFDTQIWSSVDLDARSAAGRTAMAMVQFNASISDASAGYAQGAKQIRESTTSISNAALQFQQIVQLFGAEIKGVPQALDDVRRATAASAEALEELIRVGSRTVANLDVSVAAFRTTIDREFAEAAKLQHRSGQDLAKSAQRFEDATERIQSGSHHLNRTAQANEAAFQRMDESIRQLVLTGNQQFRDAVETLTGRVAAFSQETAVLAAIVDSVAGEFSKITGGLVPSISSLRETIDNRFVAAVSQQSAHVEAVNQSMQQLREAADGMSQGAITLNAMLHEMSEFVRQTKTMHESLTHAASNLTDVACKSGSEPGRHGDQARAATQQAHAIDEISVSLARFTKHLSEFVSTGIEPATQRLAALHDTLADFEDAIDTSYEFGDAGPHTAQPTQGNDIDHSETDAQRGFISWLSRRPR